MELTKRLQEYQVKTAIQEKVNVILPHLKYFLITVKLDII